VAGPHKTHLNVPWKEIRRRKGRKAGFTPGPAAQKKEEISSHFAKKKGGALTPLVIKRRIQFLSWGEKKRKKSRTGRVRRREESQGGKKGGGGQAVGSDCASLKGGASSSGGEGTETLAHAGSPCQKKKENPFRGGGGKRPWGALGYEEKGTFHLWGGWAPRGGRRGGFLVSGAREKRRNRSNRDAPSPVGERIPVPTGKGQKREKEGVGERVGARAREGRKEKNRSVQKNPPSDRSSREKRKGFPHPQTRGEGAELKKKGRVSGKSSLFQGRCVSPSGGKGNSLPVGGKRKKKGPITPTRTRPPRSPE